MSCIKYIHKYTRCRNSKTDAIKIESLASLAIYRIFNLGTLILVKIQWYNEHCFPPKGWKSRHVIHKIFTRETMKTRKAEMCLKQNLEAAKLCRVERQMTEEGIIFSIYSCLHLLFLHVLSFSFCIRLDDVFRYEENYSNCLDPLKTQFVIKLPV